MSPTGRRPNGCTIHTYAEKGLTRGCGAALKVQCPRCSPYSLNSSTQTRACLDQALREGPARGSAFADIELQGSS